MARAEIYPVVAGTRLSDEHGKMLEEIAEFDDRDKSYIIRKLIEKPLEERHAQIQKERKRKAAA